MKAIQQTTVVLTLELTEDEMDWLHNLTRNYLGPPQLAEAKETQIIRQDFFDATEVT